METLRLLVADDEQGMCRGVERALRKYKFDLSDLDMEVAFNVATASTAQEANDYIKQNDVDLLLLDHKLPDKTGLQLLTEMDSAKDISSDFLTIVITAYASLETAVEATKKGAYDFMAKPFTPEEIRGVVRKAARHLLLQRQAQRLADEKRKVRFEFASVLSHELKRPIAAVDGYLQVMKQRAKGDDLADYDHYIDRTIDRLGSMRKLINDMLNMTAIESGQKKREMDDIDLVYTAGTVIDGFLPETEEKSINITTDLPEKMNIVADAGEIEMILNNLISNAVKYNRQDGSVHVEISGEETYAKVKVSDTGIGMTEEESAKLFEDFTRIKNDKTRHIEGSGLGLSTVKKLATLYGGDVSVDSEPDVGTTVEVVLKSQDAVKYSEKNEE